MHAHGFAWARPARRDHVRPCAWRPEDVFPDRPTRLLPQRVLPVTWILGAFVVFTLPLAYLALTEPDSSLLLRLELAYMLGLGVTHFVITPTIYLQSSNLRRLQQLLAEPADLLRHPSRHLRVLRPLPGPGTGRAFAARRRGIPIHDPGHRLPAFQPAKFRGSCNCSRLGPGRVLRVAAASGVLVCMGGGRRTVGHLLSAAAGWTPVCTGAVGAHWVFATILAGLGLTILAGDSRDGPHR